MKYYELDLPPGCKVVGRLYWDENPASLSEDMVDIIIGDVLVSVGFEDDSYRIVATPAHDFGPILCEEETSSVIEAQRLTESMVRSFVKTKTKFVLSLDFHNYDLITARETLISAKSQILDEHTTCSGFMFLIETYQTIDELQAIFNEAKITPYQTDYKL